MYLSWKHNGSGDNKVSRNPFTYKHVGLCHHIFHSQKRSNWNDIIPILIIAWFLESCSSFRQGLLLGPRETFCMVLVACNTFRLPEWSYLAIIQNFHRNYFHGIQISQYHSTYYFAIIHAFMINLEICSCMAFATIPRCKWIFPWTTFVWLFTGVFPCEFWDFQSA